MHMWGGAYINARVSKEANACDQTDFDVEPALERVRWNAWRKQGESIREGCIVNFSEGRAATLIQSGDVRLVGTKLFWVGLVLGKLLGGVGHWRGGKQAIVYLVLPRKGL